MQRVFKGGAVLALIAILTAPVLYADDPPPGTEPPEARIGPPTGVTSNDTASGTEPPGVRIRPPIGMTSSDPGTEPPGVRITPPIGVTSGVRIAPPIGATSTEPTLFELLWDWLQVRIGPPIG